MAVKRCRFCGDVVSEKCKSIPFCEKCIAYLGVRDFYSETGIENKANCIIRSDNKIFRNVSELVKLGVFKSRENFNYYYKKGGTCATGLDGYQYKKCRHIYFSRNLIETEDIRRELKRLREEQA